MKLALKIQIQSLIKSSGRNFTKIIKKSLIINNKIFFPENVFYEDNAISGLFVLYAKKISKVNQYLYYYVIHKDSTIHNAPNNFNDKILAGETYYQTMKERGFLQEYTEEVKIRYFLLYFKINFRLVMKYDINFLSTLNDIVTAMEKNGIQIQSKAIQKELKRKEKFEIWLFQCFPSVFTLYVRIKYNKFKEEI